MAMKVSLVTWYIGAILSWLTALMAKGAVESAAWFNPVLFVYSLICLIVIMIALDGTILLTVRADTLYVRGILRRTELHRDSCRFIVERIGRGRSSSKAVLLTDGQHHRRICYYWMFGGLLASRAVARLETNLLKS